MNAKTFEYQLLTATLKNILKANRLTYKEIALALKLSEASIKRILSRRDGPIGKLDEICKVLGISFSDLVTEAHQNQKTIRYLTETQEDFFSKNLNYFDFFSTLVSRRATIEDIRAKHRLSQASVRKYLSRLEKLGLIEVHAKDRIKFLIQEPIGFSKNSRFRQVMTKRFAATMFTRLGEASAASTLVTREWLLSRTALDEFSKAFKQLCSEFDERSAREAKFTPVSTLIPVSLLVSAIPSAFEYPISNL